VKNRVATEFCPSCNGVLDGSYIVDVQPSGCVIVRGEDARSCESHDCTARNCDHEPNTHLVTDAQGCPRCVNYVIDETEHAFSCVATLAGGGCGIEQPLEAMKLALDNHPDNVGFLRPLSHLAVVIIADEDDCSARDATTLFDPEPVDVMGPLTQPVHRLSARA
jgi:hypothetical protein